MVKAVVAADQEDISKEEVEIPDTGKNKSFVSCGVQAGSCSLPHKQINLQDFLSMTMKNTDIPYTIDFFALNLFKK